MRMVIVEIWCKKKEKRLKRYTEWFVNPVSMTREEKIAHAISEVTRKFLWLFGPTAYVKHHVGNQ